MQHIMRPSLSSHSVKLCLAILLVMVAIVAIGCQSIGTRLPATEHPTLYDGVDPLPAPVYAAVV